MSQGKMTYVRRDDNLQFEASFDEDEQAALALGIVLGLSDMGQTRFIKDLHAVLAGRAKVSPLAKAVADLLRKGQHERIEIVIPKNGRLLQ